MTVVLVVVAIQFASQGAHVRELRLLLAFLEGHRRPHRMKSNLDEGKISKRLFRFTFCTKQDRRYSDPKARNG